MRERAAGNVAHQSWLRSGKRSAPASRGVRLDLDTGAIFQQKRDGEERRPGVGVPGVSPFRLERNCTARRRAGGSASQLSVSAGAGREQVKHIDVVIIGASLAGAACVRELWRRGIDAVAFERDSFPREKVCGGFLSPGAVQLLCELDVLGAVREAGAVEVRSTHIRFGDVDESFELPRPGLGLSRRALDAILANHKGVRQGTVRDVRRTSDGFRVQLDDEDVSARVVVDATGKLSRFTRRCYTDQFGVQFYETGSCGDILDFWFFQDGYGGAVTVEGGRSNACFLVYKDALPRYLNKPGCRVTGPVAYDRRVSDFIAIGDAAGMIDPFCGEGMRHALDTGMLAARAVVGGLAGGRSYDAMQASYERERAERWKGKRRVGAVVRRLLKYPRFAAAGFNFGPEWFLRQLWE